MKRWIPFSAATLACLVFAAPLARAHGVDCTQPIDDWGDAPECIPAYPSGVIGHFPTCSAFCGPGTQELVPGCLPASSPPGPTGFMHNVTPGTAPHIWLGCYPVPSSGLLGGIDGEPDGKVNTPSVGTSACLSGEPTDCVEVAFGGMTFDQDECYSDPVDHGVDGPVIFPSCAMFALPFHTANCGPTDVQAFLNICVDWNEDGDWNDVVPCGPPAGGLSGCAYEWAVKNAPVVIPPGCGLQASPPFLTGPRPGNTWFRISLTLEPVNDDYPWAGSATMPNQMALGGETEDYPASISPPVPTTPETWGKLKASYR